MWLWCGCPLPLVGTLKQGADAEASSWRRPLPRMFAAALLLLLQLLNLLSRMLRAARALRKRCLLHPGPPGSRCTDIARCACCGRRLGHQEARDCAAVCPWQVSKVCRRDGQTVAGYRLGSAPAGGKVPVGGAVWWGLGVGVGGWSGATSRAAAHAAMVPGRGSRRENQSACCAGGAWVVSTACIHHTTGQGLGSSLGAEEREGGLGNHVRAGPAGTKAWHGAALASVRAHVGATPAEGRPGQG